MYRYNHPWIPFGLSKNRMVNNDMNDTAVTEILRNNNDVEINKKTSMKRRDYHHHNVILPSSQDDEDDNNNNNHNQNLNYDDDGMIIDNRGNNYGPNKRLRFGSFPTTIDNINDNENENFKKKKNINNNRDWNPFCLQEEFSSRQPNVAKKNEEAMMDTSSNKKNDASTTEWWKQLSSISSGKGIIRSSDGMDTTESLLDEDNDGDGEEEEVTAIESMVVCHVCQKPFQLSLPIVRDVMPENSILNYFALKPSSSNSSHDDDDKRMTIACQDCDYDRDTKRRGGEGEGYIHTSRNNIHAKNPSICSCCDRPNCVYCRTRCQKCQGSFCSFCTVTVESDVLQPHERSNSGGILCLDCYDNHQES